MLHFHVANMTCGGCVKGVTRAIQQVATEARVDVDLSKREVSVSGAHDRDAVLQSIRTAGYEATAL